MLLQHCSWSGSTMASDYILMCAAVESSTAAPPYPGTVSKSSTIFANAFSPDLSPLICPESTAGFLSSSKSCTWDGYTTALISDRLWPAFGVIQLNSWKFLRSCRLEKLSQTRYGPDVCDLCDTFLHYIQAKKNYEHVEISCKKITYVSSEISCCKCMRSPHMHRFLAQSIMQTLATISSTSGHCLSQTPSWALFFYLL